MSLNYNTRSNGTGLHGTGRGRKERNEVQKHALENSMNNLQLFAEGEGDGSGAGTETRTELEQDLVITATKYLDDFLKEGDNQAEYDRRIRKQ